MGSTKVQLIRLEPEELVFDMMEKEPTVVLKIHNTSEKMIAFKVKTTHPKRYLVRPNQDVIPVAGTSNVKINLQIKDAKQLRQERISGIETLDKDCKDNKFLVQCAVVKEKLLPEIEELYFQGTTKALASKLKDLWSHTTREEFVNKKLSCSFQYPEDTGSLMEVNKVDGAKIPFNLELDDGQGKESGAESSMQEDIGELRKKYNELINFTVQLTSERDRFKASLKDASKEVQLLKKGQQSKNQSSQRDQDDSESRLPSTDVASGTFSLWQMMLVAVVAFLMGRLVM